MIRFLLSLSLCLWAVSTAAQSPCGRDGAPCETTLGTYRLALPEGERPAAGHPALLFFHGAGGSGARTLANDRLRAAFLERGWAILAPDGKKRPGSRFGPGWSFHPARPQFRDEAAFAREVIDDAASRYGIDRDNVLMSGFSIGGSLVWYLACAEPDLARAYAPVAGAFWRPHPDMNACAGPVRLLHTHGWRDNTVPLEGRPLRSADILQGDVFHGLSILRVANGCSGLRADAFETDAAFWRRKWTRCTQGSALEFALHTGGHSVPSDWSEMAMNWYQSLFDGKTALAD